MQRTGEDNDYYTISVRIVFMLIGSPAYNFCRILCFEISAKRGKAYTLTFVREAVAVTDIPTTLIELIKQRRRWLNGAFFALLYYIMKFWKLLERSDHSFGRRIALSIQYMYYLSLIFFNWFGVALLYLSFVMIVTFAVQPIRSDFLR